MADVLNAVFAEALKQFVGREHSLVRRDVHEQAICGRLARYVEVAKDNHGLAQYYVDVKYNRHGERRKTILNAKTGQPINIVCDLILHSRGELEDDNLIAVEMKKADGSETDKQNDRERLQALTTACPEGAPSEHVCGYKVGHFLEVDVKNASLLVEEYRAGKLIAKSALEFAAGRSPSDSISFAKNESETRKSTRTKS